jgi:hypothetical protein
MQLIGFNIHNREAVNSHNASDLVQGVNIVSELAEVLALVFVFVTGDLSNMLTVIFMLKVGIVGRSEVKHNILLAILLFLLDDYTIAMSHSHSRHFKKKVLGIIEVKLLLGVLDKFFHDFEILRVRY